MTRLPRTLLAGLALSLSLAALAQFNPLSASLQPKDPKKPLHMLVEKTWGEADIAIQPHEVTRTEKHLPRSSHDLSLGSFKVENGLGPLMLIVDFGGRVIDEQAKSSAIVQVDIECPEVSNGCPYPIQKSVIGYDDRYMAKFRLPHQGSDRAMVLGREGHNYGFAPGTLVNMDIRLQQPTNIEPVQIKAWVFHGEHEHQLPHGNTTRLGTFWKVLGAGLLVVVLGWWWLRRS